MNRQIARLAMISLGLIGAPAALFKVDLGLNSDERLFCFGLFEHYRQNGAKPNPSNIRLSVMTASPTRRANEPITTMLGTKNTSVSLGSSARSSATHAGIAQRGCRPARSMHPATEK